jgi:hypothetical protein
MAKAFRDDPPCNFPKSTCAASSGFSHLHFCVRVSEYRALFSRQVGEHGSDVDTEGIGRNILLGSLLKKAGTLRRIVITDYRFSDPRRVLCCKTLQCIHIYPLKTCAARVNSTREAALQPQAGDGRWRHL